jgi:hypothetical protein
VDEAPKSGRGIRILAILPAALAWAIALISGSWLINPELRTLEYFVWFGLSVFLAVVFTRLAVGPRPQ